MKVFTPIYLIQNFLQPGPQLPAPLVSLQTGVVFPLYSPLKHNRQCNDSDDWTVTVLKIDPVTWNSY